LMFSMVKAFRGFARDFTSHNRNGKKVVNYKGNHLLIIFLIIFIQLLVVELIQRESIWQTFVWLGEYYYIFLINYLLTLF